MSHDDFYHLLSNQLDLCSCSIRSGTELSLSSGSEANYEESEEVIITGLDINISLDGGLPLSNKRAQLVSGDIHSVEIGVARAAFDILHHKSYLAVALFCSLVILLQISQASLKHSSL